MSADSASPAPSSALEDPAPARVPSSAEVAPPPEGRATASPGDARRTNRPVTVVALMLALFMGAMEMTVVSTAMPTVVGDLGGALHYAWVFSAYMLASTVMVPIHGKLADLYGRKPVMLVSLAIFLVGSMASGQAHSMTSLIVWRAIQGVGAGGLQPIAITIVGDVFDLKERARMQGLFGAVWGIAGLAGPLIGGVIVANLSWRWIFYVNVPFGLLCGVLLTTALHENVERKERKLDLPGAALLSGAVVALLLGVEGLQPLVLLPACALLLVAFLRAEKTAPEPMLPPRLFGQRLLATASAVSVASGAAMIGLVTFVPLYAQGVLGFSPAASGACIAPMAIGWPLSSAIAGRLLGRVGFRPLIRAGSVVVVLAASGLAWAMARGATGLELKVAAACFGVGMGFANTALLIAVQTSVPFRERGVATSSTMFFRSIGGTVGVGVMGVILAQPLLANPVARDAGGAELVARVLGPDRLHVPVEILRGIAGDLALGLARVAWVGAGLAAASCLFAFAFPEPVRDDAGRLAAPKP